MKRAGALIALTLFATGASWVDRWQHARAGFGDDELTSQ